MLEIVRETGVPIGQLKLELTETMLADDIDEVVRRRPSSSRTACCCRWTTLGRTLGLEVIAEGVETSEHRRTLAEMGCDNYQGFFFARPLASVDFDAFVIESDAGARAAEQATKLVPVALPA